MNNRKPEPKDFKNFLFNTLTVNEFNHLPDNLGVSRKMLTILMKNPSRLNLFQLNKLSEITGQSIQKFQELAETVT